MPLGPASLSQAPHIWHSLLSHVRHHFYHLRRLWHCLAPHNNFMRIAHVCVCSCPCCSHSSGSMEPLVAAPLSLCCFVIPGAAWMYSGYPKSSWSLNDLMVSPQRPCPPLSSFSLARCLLEMLLPVRPALWAPMQGLHKLHKQCPIQDFGHTSCGSRAPWKLSEHDDCAASAPSWSIIPLNTPHPFSCLARLCIFSGAVPPGATTPPSAHAGSGGNTTVLLPVPPTPVTHSPTST